MALDKTLTLADVLIALRRRLIDARQRYDLEALAELVAALSMLVNAAKDYDRPRATELIAALDRAARNAIMDIPDEPPTPDEIRQALGG